MVTGIAFFPGQVSPMFPMVASLGPDCSSTPIPGQVIVVLDSLVHYDSPFGSYPAPNTVTPAASGDTLIWNVADVTTLTYYGFYNFSFNYITDVSATIGDTVHIKVTILPVSGDVDPANNVYERDFVVGNSYDPNNKEVLPAGSGPAGFIPASTPKLEYIVNFQNTGTAPAQNIYILDTLDSDLNVSSLEIIASSHLQTTTLLPGNVLKFNFSNIMLPDSNSNEMMSHGFVKYSISPNAGLDPGDQITNTAYIYFDFNSPIITNTALNTIEFTTGIKGSAEYQLGVFPNPANSRINVVFEDKASKDLNIKITNVSGQIVFEENKTNFDGRYSETIDLTMNSKGVYLLQITTDKHVVHQKIVKN
jgi:hypothetical protein